MSRNPTRKLLFQPALILLPGLALLGISCNGYTSRQVSDPTPAIVRLRAGGELKAEVDRLAEPLIASHEIHDMVVGVLHPDGTAECFSYGGPQPPGPDTIFEIGSVTKVFVASLLSLLVTEGRLHYEDTVRSILPPEVKVNNLVGNLTLYELVTHTAGLPRQPNTLTQMRYFMDFEFAGRNPYGYITKPYLYRFLHYCRVPPKEDRCYNYSSIGYGLLGHLMELKTGRSLPELMEEKICRPLNLRDTCFTLTADQQRRKAIGHVGAAPKFLRRNQPMRHWEMGEIMQASGGMHSTLHDLLIFARANLGMTGLPLEASLAATRRVVIRTAREDITPGWMINHFPAWNTQITFINGILSGYSAQLGMDPDKKVAVVVLTTNFNWVDKVGHNLLLRLAAASGADHPKIANDKTAQVQARVNP